MAQKLVYGTAGYRGKAKLMDELVRRTAFFAGLRARKMNKTIGLMITASHNPPEDNGIKVIDFDGGMLSIDCEAELDAIVNDPGDYCFTINDDCHSDASGAYVAVGTDTRQSASVLLARALEGLVMARAHVLVFPRHTTPQLHYVVHKRNNPSAGNPLDYVLRFRNAFKNFIDLLNHSPAKTSPVYVDCANGVGALWLTDYFPFEGLHVRNVNVDHFERLNANCGADFVKLHLLLPFDDNDFAMGARCASLDGDADRLIYYYTRRCSSTTDKPSLKFVLMDGDHIAALFALYIQDLIGQLDEFLTRDGVKLTVGIVQTAYANGGSGIFFREKFGINPVITKTGVKYLERAAADFDIGIYFEANGHGSIHFSPKFHDFINTYEKKVISNDENLPKAMKLMYYFSKIINEVVGDGIADFLAVEAILRAYDWSIEDWHHKTYTDMPSMQIKTRVKNIAMFRSADDTDEKLVRPDNLQQQIDAIVGKYEGARAFVRPSGTEPFVRIYSEAPIEKQARVLASELEKLLFESFIR